MTDTAAPVSPRSAKLAANASRTARNRASHRPLTCPSRMTGVRLPGYLRCCPPA